MYLDANNLYGCAMSQKLPTNGFEWVKELSQFNEDFIKNIVVVEYPKKLFNLHCNLSSLAETKKIKKCNKLLCNIRNYVVHTRALKQALNHGLILKKVHISIQFNKKAW